MDKAAPPPERAPRQAPPTTDPPEGWVEVQGELSASSGLALLLVEGHQPPALAVTNNNTVCRAFQSSPTHAHLCEPYCGQAHARALKAGSRTDYRCHAGLHCFAMPVRLEAERNLAVIGGRAFLRGADYRALAERVRMGDLTDLADADLFRNVIFSLGRNLDELAGRVSAATERFVAGKAGDAVAGDRRVGQESMAVREDTAAEGPGEEVVKEEEQYGAGTRTIGEEPPTGIVAGGPPVRLPSNSTLGESCMAVVGELGERQGVSDLALMLRADDGFTAVCATGAFGKRPPRVSLKPKEIKLLMAATHGDSIAVPAAGRSSSKHEDAIELFPLLVGEEIKGALLVGDKSLSAEQRAAIARFCRDVAMPVEVLRLREELDRRTRAATQLQAFSEIVNAARPEEAYAAILRHSAELLRAERGSLLLFDENSNELSVKAAVGPRAEVAREARVRVGEGVAGAVLSEGRPVVVRDVSTLHGWQPASAERRYKTGSFISYPIAIGGRKVGVLNVTDKAGGGSYDEFDLGLLDLIAPQVALALDRAEWHQKATQFELLSITDPLTGLLNRRYLEERLSEELERSKRHRFAMSFLMVDIDDFKTYNDRHGHQAGDVALQMAAQCMKSALRAADVASRYGGEEFSILLPQTSAQEAKVIAERIRRKVERTQFPHGKSQPLGAVTVSIGISSFGPQADTPASVIYAADQALYAAKNRGKNCVEVFEPKEAAPTEDDAG